MCAAPGKALCEKNKKLKKKKKFIFSFASSTGQH